MSSSTRVPSTGSDPAIGQTTITGMTTGAVGPGTRAPSFVMTLESDPLRLFERWFVEVLQALERVPNNDGGIIAVGACCTLYERFVSFELNDEQPNTTAIGACVERDFSISHGATVWRVLRHGLLHQGMPNSTRGDWCFDVSTPRALDYDVRSSSVVVNPWKFRDQVLAIVRAAPACITSGFNPFGTVFVVG